MARESGTGAAITEVEKWRSGKVEKWKSGEVSESEKFNLLPRSTIATRKPASCSWQRVRSGGSPFERCKQLDVLTTYFSTFPLFHFSTFPLWS
jgi:hypothetical protein